MEKIIKILKEKPLSGQDILDACNNEIKIMKYNQFSKHKTIDDAFGEFDGIAILYELRSSYGHWVLLLRHHSYKCIEYFDSYGLFIDEPLKIINKEFKEKSGQNEMYLSILLNKSKYNIICNDIEIQIKNSSVSSCGRHLALRFLMKHLPLKEYVYIMTSDKNNNPDTIVTLLTAFI